MLKLSTDLFCYWLGFVDSAQSYRAIALTCKQLAHRCSLFSAKAKNRFAVELETGQRKFRTKHWLFLGPYIEIVPQFVTTLLEPYPQMQASCLPSGVLHGLVDFGFGLSFVMDAGRQIGPTTVEHGGCKIVFHAPVVLSPSHFIGCVTHHGKTEDEYVQHRFEICDGQILYNKLLCKEGTFTGVTMDLELQKLGWSFKYNWRDDLAEFSFVRAERTKVYHLLTYTHQRIWEVDVKKKCWKNSAEVKYI